MLTVVLVLGTVARAGLVAGDDSLYWPDEVFKSLEPAHRAAFGYGFRAWEFVHGASNWTFAGLLAGVLRGLSAVGVDDPAAYVVVIRALLAASTLGAAWAAHRLARSLGASDLVAPVAAALVALLAPIVYFSHRALTETASLLPVTLGLALALPPAASKRATTVGASLLGLAVLFRLQNGLFCLGLLAVLAARRDWSPLRRAAAVLLSCAGVLGVMDWATWGSPFHSAVEYGRFSLGGGASLFGASAFWYYASFLAASIGPGVVVLGIVALLGCRRAPALAAITAGFVLVHCLEPHKEARFVLPALPLLAVLVALGLDAVVRRPWVARRPAAAMALVVVVIGAAAASGVGVRRLTYGQVGQGHLFNPSASAYEHGDAVNRLLLAAHDRADLCGLEVEVEVVVFTGGYGYLHRDVPLYDKDGPPRSSGRFNYAIGLWDTHDPGVVATAGGLALTQVGPPSSCAPDPDFDDRLSGGRRPS